MLTRLKVAGFKNLIELDVHFGPFTCIVGPNGAGKSNLLDAIRFLSALADRSLHEAASLVRDEKGRSGDPKALFHWAGGHRCKTIHFYAEMIVPSSGIDNLGQSVEASVTFLTYSLEIGLRDLGADNSLGELEILREELSYVRKGSAADHLQFPHEKVWRSSVVTGRRFSPELISTIGAEGSRVIKLHQDKGHGHPRPILAKTLPRTVLSTVTTENPTAVLAQIELRSWRQLQLEPSALRSPDPFTAKPRIEPDGSHVASTISRLIKGESSLAGNSASHSQSRVTTVLANRLAQLVGDIRSVHVDRDDKRELLTVIAKMTDGAEYAARDLSDGTLRFLALATVESDPEATGLICLEEPENGIHPERVPAMVQLLSDIAVDTSEPIGPENPLRQVIINSHSPIVAAEVPADSLLLAEGLEQSIGGGKARGLSLACLPGTWRSTIEGYRVAPLGRVLALLNPSPLRIPEDDDNRGRRVIDQPEIRQFVLPLEPVA